MAVNQDHLLNAVNAVRKLRDDAEDLIAQGADFEPVRAVLQETIRNLCKLAVMPKLEDIQ